MHNLWTQISIDFKKPLKFTLQLKNWNFVIFAIKLGLVMHNYLLILHPTKQFHAIVVANFLCLIWTNFLYVTPMNFYNQSLCLAEIGSREVGLAYANRSLCFLQMKMFGWHRFGDKKQLFRKCIAQLSQIKSDENYAGTTSVLEIRYIDTRKTISVKGKFLCVPTTLTFFFKKRLQHMLPI